MLNNMRLLISYNKMTYVLSSAWIRNIILPIWNLQWLEQFLKGALFLKKANHNITRLYLSVILIFRSFWAQTRKRSVLGHFREGSNASSTCKLCSVLCSWVLNQRVDTPVWNMTFDPWALASWQPLDLAVKQLGRFCTGTQGHKWWAVCAVIPPPLMLRYHRS